MHDCRSSMIVHSLMGSPSRHLVYSSSMITMVFRGRQKSLLQMIAECLQSLPYAVLASLNSRKSSGHHQAKA